MRARARIVIALAVVVALQTGCWFGTGSTSDIRHAYTRQTGVQLRPEFGVRLGRLSLGIVKSGVKVASDEPVSFKGIHRVEVGIYNVAPGSLVEPRRARLTSLDLPDWEPLVRVRVGFEESLVLVKAEGEEVRAMLVLVQDDEEFVVVRVKGKLHKVLPALLEKSGWSGLHGALDPEKLD